MKNVIGERLWRDDEVRPYVDGSKTTEEMWYAKTMCLEHSDKDEGEKDRPVYCIWKIRPYRNVVFFTCIEARYFLPPYDDIPVFCKNTSCPNYDDSIQMNETEILK